MSGPRSTMAAPRSRICSLSLLTLFSISLILISLSLFVYTKPSNKPFIDYRNQFSVSVSFTPPSLSPLEQSNSTNNTHASVSSSSPPMSLVEQSNSTNNTLASIFSPSPMSLLGQSKTTNTTISSVSFSSSFSDPGNRKKSPSPTSKRIVIRKRSGLDKIEAELAKSRAAIKKAALTQNYRSSLYKNPAAFHQLSYF
ncbi:hypothetical protein EUTSA_v10004953mg [Eutrema salsugineum]|uniref:Uncharacterized protein n=1 Tax=Eutrema salsugineum TaxID=72664 RepID=V4K6Q5_EUTSA|nr:hypothetical protein EUTSA_v10004953mg [Eutrema salsugineum]